MRHLLYEAAVVAASAALGLAFLAAAAAWAIVILPLAAAAWLASPGREDA